MALLDATQFASQQAALAAQLGPDALANYFNTQLSGAQATNQPNDPYVTYLQSVQNSVLGLDQTYLNAFNQVQTEANNFAASPKGSASIYGQYGGAVLGPNNPGNANYENALTSESNTYQTYLNQEQADILGYNNALQTFQGQAQQQNAQSNQTLLDITNAAQKQQIANAQIAEQQRQQAQIAQQTATAAKVQSYATPMLAAQAVGSTQAAQTNPSGQMLDKLYPQSNDAGAGTQPQKDQSFNTQQQTNQVANTPPGPGGNSNQVTQLPAINGQSNQVTR
jgi:hypothetical protein